MKIFAISDLHLSTAVEKPMNVFGSSWDNYVEEIIADWNDKVSDEDVVLLAGDFSWAMRIDEALPDFEVLANLKGKKVLLRGNHDYWWNSISQVRDNLPCGFYAVQNDCLRFGNFLICGSRGWVCPDGNNLSADDKKIFLRENERLALSLGAMEKMRKDDDKVVAMMHYPPFNGKFDESPYVQQFVKHNVGKVVYGHLHGKDCRVEKHLCKFGIEFFLTSCDQVENKLVLIDQD